MEDIVGGSCFVGGVGVGGGEFGGCFCGGMSSVGGEVCRVE